MRKGSATATTRAALSRYEAKRDFTQTKEPSGRLAVLASSQKRFVIQKHAATRLHYDLRLELDGVFKSWAVTKGPSVAPSAKRLAVEVEDHPLDYGDFEGTIPKGQYGGGTVQLWDRGYWTPEGTEDPAKSLKSGQLKFRLAGKRLQGSWVLVRLKADRSGAKRTNWLLIKHRDDAAGTEAHAQALLDADSSVASGRSMAQIEQGKGKAPSPFMLAKGQVKADAIWHSNKADQSARIPVPSLAKKARPAATSQAPASPGDRPARAAPNAKLPEKAAPRSQTKRKKTAPSAAMGSSGKGVAQVMGVNISKPDKMLWPPLGPQEGVNKLDLAQYLEAIGEWMLPHLKGRPCSLVRAPDGIAGERFFQRHAMPGISKLFTLVKVKGERAPYVQIDHVETLAAVAQIGALEIHPWNCAVGVPEVAGRLVFDLDPAPDVTFAAVVTAALEVRDRLKAVGLECFCKTTGGKGLHVVTPLTPGKDAVPWAAAKDFAHLLCTQMAHDSPAKYLDTMAKKDRTGRIFLDYLRNDRTATAVAVLSPRARPGALVSMPLHWRAVKPDLDPAQYTIRSAPALLRKSKPWQGYTEAARPLKKAIALMSP